MKECRNPHCDMYPHYGVAPHRHNMARTGSVIGSTEILPKEQWPAHFREDPEAPGCGTYYCPDCHGGGSEGKV